MYSLNVPIPEWVTRLASDLLPYLAPFNRTHNRRALACKRFEDADLDRLRKQLRCTFAGQPAFEVRITSVRFFEEPLRGAAPVVYLAVDSPGLLDLHRALTDDFDAIERIKGDDYVPYVTLARGGSIADARAVTSQSLDPIKWTVLQLDIYDSSFRETTAPISLPV